MGQHLLNGLFSTTGSDKKVSKTWTYYQQPIAKLEVPGFSPFFGLQLAIWQLRPLDLQQQYPLDSLQGRLGFLAWCVVHGRNEYAALRELQVFWDALAQPADIATTAYSGAITRLMHLVALSRSDLKIDYKLATEAEQIALLRWYCLHGWIETGLAPEDLADCQKALFETKLVNNFSFIEQFIYDTRYDLKDHYNLDTSQGQTDFRYWIDQYGKQETILGLLNPRAYKEKESTVTTQNKVGVNLIGYAFGELGIGEDVRMAALALEAANIPFTVINFRPGDDIRQNDRSIAQWVTNDPIYNVNIVCLTALEHLRLYAEQGEALFKDRYNIGYWPWELQNWPANWQHCFSMVDEVWASSQHTWQAAQKVSSVPVHIMPMAVAIPKVKRYTRKQWSLPETDYLFVFSFDGNSSLARKNPLGVIEAFKLAFPNGHEAAGLVIKCMRPDINNPAWQRILKLAATDSRIHIIDQMLSKPEVLGLYKVCDCFVSLHRAEGFGRGIAEALLLGLNVIATNHGGNVDFCLPGSAHLIPYQPVSVGKNDYVESYGQMWAEPDIGNAASIMRGVACQVRRNNKSVTKAIKNRFANIQIGSRYQKRLSLTFMKLK
jgi:glycosyltransferase involved in cell wall biosynthesis